MNSPRKRTDRWQLLALLALLGVGHWLLAPAVVNGDGVGYLKQLDGTTIAAGHPAYLPLARLLTAPLRGAPPLAAVPILRLLSLLSVLGALLLAHATARAVGVDRRPALFVVALLGVSHGVIRASHQVEVYGVALLATTAALWALARAAAASRRALWWAALSGLSGGLAALLHLTLIALALPPSWLLLRRSTRRGRGAALMVALCCFVAVVVAGLLAAVRQAGLAGAAEALRWLLSADHGIPYQLHLWTPLTALWGISRTLLAAPYPHAAPWWQVILASGGAAAVLLAMVWAAATARGSTSGPGHPRWWPAVVWSWVAPLALFGALFFPSDPERWLFVAPPLAIVAARAARRRAAWALLLPLALGNALLLTPAALDRRQLRRARTAERLLRPQDLLLSPGHGWDELVGLGTHQPPRRYPLVHFVGAERDLRRALQRMHREIAAARARGARVFVARLQPDGDRRGFKELAWFGFGPAGLQRELARYRPRRVGTGLWQLSAGFR